MKKIKITEKQAKLLETLNSKKVLKVTKEQYNRIIESELRPSLTETPELHEEDLNEELFREFVNELYGMNEEGKELRFEKVCKLMEAAGLIEGGKILKEKFGKDPKKVKEVISKGLKRLEECGSAYEAVELMEATLNDPEGDKVRDSLKNQLQGKPSKDYAPDVENSYTPSSSKPKDDTINEPEDKPEYRQLELPLDERERLGGKRAVGLDILKVAPFSELPESRSGMGDYTTRMELRLPSLTTGDAAEIIFSKADLIGSEFQGPKMVHKNPGYIKIFKSKFGAEPVFVNITDKGADIDENLAPKFREWKESYINAKKSYLSDLRDKGNSGLDEMDTSALANAQIVGPFGSEPAFKSNVNSELTDKIYEALKKK